MSDTELKKPKKKDRSNETPEERQARRERRALRKLKKQQEQREHEEKASERKDESQLNRQDSDQILDKGQKSEQEEDQAQEKSIKSSEKNEHMEIKASESEDGTEKKTKGKQAKNKAKESSGEESPQEKAREGEKRTKKKEKKKKIKKSSKKEQQHDSSNSEDELKEKKKARKIKKKDAIENDLNPSKHAKASIGNPVMSSLAHALQAIHLTSALGLGLRDLELPNNIVQKKCSEILQFESEHAMCLRVQFTDDLPEDPLIIHPMVRVHIVDVTTGRYLVKDKHTEPAINHHENITFLNCGSTSRETSMCHFIPPVMTQACALGSENQGAPMWNEDIFIHDLYEHIVHPSTVILFELLDFGFNIPTHKQTPEGLYSIAWAYLRPVGEGGRLNVPSQPLMGTQIPQSLRLQLYTYESGSWLVDAQARDLGFFEDIPPVPKVFLQYQRFKHNPFPSTLHISIVPEPMVKPLAVLEYPKRPNEIEYHELTLGDLEKQTDDQPTNAGIAGTNVNLHLTPSMRCKRFPNESCLIPQRILHKLPSGSYGCMSIEFSPSGQYIAAACSDLNLYPIRIFDVDSGETKKVFLGHRGLVHSIRWDAEETKVISASADGTARIWSLAASTVGVSSVINVSVALVHEPPTFVYAVEFLSTAQDICYTGAFDSKIRLWDCKSGHMLGYIQDEDQKDKSAVNCLRFDPKNGRLFSGHESGLIYVWGMTEEGVNASDYHLIRIIRPIGNIPQAITCLQLHPKKNYLLVQTKGDALVQYELRSFLLVNKGYTGIECNTDLIKSIFSPDGRYIISGSEDGIACLFSSHNSQRLQGGPWGTLYGDAIFDASWSPTAHIVALCSFGSGFPIMVLGAERGDESTISSIIKENENMSRLEQHEREERKKKTLERRRKRLQAKLEKEAAMAAGE